MRRLFVPHVAAAGLLLLGMATGGCSAFEPALGSDTSAGGGAGDEGGDDASVAPVTGDDDGGEAAAPPVVFARDIRPLMNRSDTDPTGHGCALCHYPGQGTEEGYMMTGLDLSTLRTLRLGGSTTGAGILDVGNPEQSGILLKLRGHYFEGARMPKSGPPYWSDAEIQLVSDWIAQGAQGNDGD